MIYFYNVSVLLDFVYYWSDTTTQERHRDVDEFELSWSSVDPLEVILLLNNKKRKK